MQCLLAFPRTKLEISHVQPSRRGTVRLYLFCLPSSVSGSKAGPPAWAKWLDLAFRSVYLGLFPVPWAFARTAVEGCYVSEQSSSFGNSEVDHFDFCFTSTTQPPTGIILGLPLPARAPTDNFPAWPRSGSARLRLLFSTRSPPDAVSASALLHRPFFLLPLAGPLTSTVFLLISSCFTVELAAAQLPGGSRQLQLPGLATHT